MIRDWLRRMWRWYAPRSIDEVLAEAIERGIRHDEAQERDARHRP